MLTFPNVTPAAFALVLDQLRKEGSRVVDVPSVDAFEGTFRYLITGHHWPLGDIRANVAFDGATVTVDVVQPKAWEHAVGAKVQEAIDDARRRVAT